LKKDDYERYQREAKAIMQKHNAKPWSMFLPVLVNGSLLGCFFFSLSSMARAKVRCLCEWG
jgi:membrane protein insertase Oxa1/YidC/SpoIIIJ